MLIILYKFLIFIFYLPFIILIFLRKFIKKEHPHKFDIWRVTGPIPFNTVQSKINKNLITCFPTYYFFPEVFNKNYKNINTDTFKDKYPNSYMYQYWLSRDKYYEE